MFTIKVPKYNTKEAKCSSQNCQTNFDYKDKKGKILEPKRFPPVSDSNKLARKVPNLQLWSPVARTATANVRPYNKHPNPLFCQS